jgi:hypothetical protein
MVIDQWEGPFAERPPSVDPSNGAGEPELRRGTHRQRVETEAELWKLKMAPALSGGSAKW